MRDVAVGSEGNHRQRRLWLRHGGAQLKVTQRVIAGVSARSATSSLRCTDHIRSDLMQLAVLSLGLLA